MCEGLADKKRESGGIPLHPRCVSSLLRLGAHFTDSAIELPYLLVHRRRPFAAGKVDNTDRGIITTEKLLCRLDVLAVGLPVLDIRLQGLVPGNVLEAGLVEK